MLVSNRPNCERQRIVGCVAALCEAFGRKPTPATYTAYDVGLAGLAVEAVERATVKALQRHRGFMPTPAEIRELAGEVRPDDRATLAWEAFSQAVEKFGCYASPDFDDPLINATCRTLGGWVRWCDMTVEEFEKWGRQEFVKTYQSLSRSHANGEICGRLIGEHEKTNALIGQTRNSSIRVTTGLPWIGKDIATIRDASPLPRITFREVATP